MAIKILLTLNLSKFIYMRYIYFSPVIALAVYLRAWYVAQYTLPDMDPLGWHASNIGHLEPWFTWFICIALLRPQYLGQRDCRLRY